MIPLLARHTAAAAAVYVYIGLLLLLVRHCAPTLGNRSSVTLPIGQSSKVKVETNNLHARSLFPIQGGLQVIMNPEDEKGGGAIIGWKTKAG